MEPMDGTRRPVRLLPESERFWSIFSPMRVENLRSPTRPRPVRLTETTAPVLASQATPYQSLGQPFVFTKEGFHEDET